MYIRVEHDECVICQKSLVKGMSFYQIVTHDPLCSLCRKSLNGKMKKTKFRNTDLYSFYTYEDLGQYLIRYKDYLDLGLALIFLAPYNIILNALFKNYDIVLIPSSERMIERRQFNHLELMLQDCSLKKYDCLIKHEDYIQRFSHDKNLGFSFKKDITFDKVIIFDDVITSGNSMLSALDLIKPKANKVILLSVINNYGVR